METEISAKEKLIAELSAQIQSLNHDKTLELNQVVSKNKRALSELEAQLKLQAKETELEKIQSKRNTKLNSNKKKKLSPSIKTLKLSSQLKWLVKV